MADVSRGSVSSMPGSYHRLPEGSMCDEHPDVLAVRRVQGETDSFGCEYVDMCQVCLDAYHAYREQERNTPRYCNWCKCEKLGVRPHRDIDEGMAGPVYQVCGDCIAEEHKRLAEELAENPSGYDSYEFDDDPGDFDDSDAVTDYALEETAVRLGVVQPADSPKVVRPPVVTYKRKRRIVKSEGEG